MAGNIFGQIFRISTFGESHGLAVGVVIDGCSAGLEIHEEYIQKELDRRRPGQSALTTQRQEEDRIHILSGIFEGKSTGAPIVMMVYNKDQRPQDYDRFKEVYRPSHADYTYEQKYGIRDHRGGGRSSARETLARVAAGAVAKLLLQQTGIEILAFVSQVGSVRMETIPADISPQTIESNPVRCPDPGKAIEMQQVIEQVRAEGDSLGGVITCIIRNCPAGLGEPVFDKLHADLGKAMLSINAVKGFETGEGFAAAAMRGSQHNDEFVRDSEGVHTATNHSGGIQGGISNGEDILFRVAFKPVATIAKVQNTVNKEGEAASIEGKGRHDPCVVPRAVPIVEAMASLVLADHWLRGKASKF